jgi:hypothetical protein
MLTIAKYGAGLRNACGILRLLRYTATPAALCGLALAGPVFPSAQGQTLEQGIAVIRQSLAKDGLYERVTTTARGNYKSLTQRKFTLSEAKGCNLVVVAESHIHAEMPHQNRITDRRWSDIYRPDFTTMDPASATVIAPEPPQANWETKGYLVRISIEAGKPLMVGSTVDSATNQARDMPGVPTLAVYVTNKETADRLAKAFAQVATACRAGAAAK